MASLSSTVVYGDLTVNNTMTLKGASYHYSETIFYKGIRIDNDNKIYIDGSSGSATIYTSDTGNTLYMKTATGAFIHVAATTGFYFTDHEGNQRHVWHEGNSPKSSTTGSTSTTQLANSAAAKAAYDKGAEALTAANGKVSKSGDTIKGNLEIDGTLGFKAHVRSSDSDLDFNDLQDCSVYNISSASIAENKPPVSHCTLIVSGSSTWGYVAQDAIERTSNKRYMRTYHNSDNKWTEWIKIYTSADKPTKSDVGLSNVDNVKQVPTTRKIIANAPLSGTGDLSKDLTLTVLSGTTSIKGAVQLSDAVDSESTSLAATANAAKKAYDRGSLGISRSVRSPSALSKDTDLNTLNSSSHCGVYYQSANSNTTGNRESGYARIHTEHKTGNTIRIETAEGNYFEITSESARCHFDGDSYSVYHTGNKPTKADVGLGNVDNVKQVPTTRKINTTAPLSGGGDLSADRTLSVSDASTNVKGVVQLNSSTSSSSATTAATASAVKSAFDRGSSGVTKAEAAQSAVDGHIAKKDNPHGVTKSHVSLGNVDNVKQAPSTRKINTKAPISGGGDLSADRTISIADATVSAKGAVQLNDSIGYSGTDRAATSNAVKKAYDHAELAYGTAVTKEDKLDSYRKRRIFVQTSTPSTSGLDEGDLWVKPE